MSIINQVLKDLDRQRGPADGVQIAALQGIGLVQNAQVNWSTLLSRTGWGVAVLLLAFVGFQTASNWKNTTEPGAIEISETTVIEPAVPVTVTQQPDRETDTVITTVADVELEAEPESAPAEANEPMPVVADTATTEQPDSTPVMTTPPRLVKTLSIRQRADHAFVAAQRAMQRHDRVGAEQQFNNVLALYPQHMSARLQLASIYFERNDSNAAATVLQQGLSLDPTQPQIARLYAQLLATRGDLDAALVVLKPVIDSRHADAESLALRAAVLARLERHHDAESSYRQALQLDPSQANWWLGMGLSLEHQGRNRIALGAYQRADQLPLADNVKTFIQQRVQQLQNTARDH